MRRSGKIKEYRWIEDEDAYLEDLLIECKDSVIGSRAINTSFDSGVLGSDKMKLTEKMKVDGWTVINGRAVSPIITEESLSNFLYTDSYDEWYFFNTIPSGFSAIAFCNFLGLTLERASELEFEGGCNLLSSLSKYRPVAVAGWNDAYSYIMVRGE